MYRKYIEITLCSLSWFIMPNRAGSLWLYDPEEGFRDLPKKCAISFVCVWNSKQNNKCRTNWLKWDKINNWTPWKTAVGVVWERWGEVDCIMRWSTRQQFIFSAIMLMHGVCLNLRDIWLFRLNSSFVDFLMIRALALTRYLRSYGSDLLRCLCVYIRTQHNTNDRNNWTIMYTGTGTRTHTHTADTARNI